MPARVGGCRDSSCIRFFNLVEFYKEGSNDDREVAGLQMQNLR